MPGEEDSGGWDQSVAELVRLASMRRWSSDRFDGVACSCAAGRAGDGCCIEPADGSCAAAAAGGMPMPMLPTVGSSDGCDWKIIACKHHTSHLRKSMTIGPSATGAAARRLYPAANIPDSLKV